MDKDTIVLDNDDVDLEEVLKEILTPLFEQLREDVQEFVSAEVQRVVDPSAFDEDGDSPRSSNPEVKALQNKLAQMEKKAQEAEAKERSQKIENALSEAVQAFKTDVPSLATLALKHRAGELVESSTGEFITKDGKSLKDLATDFFSTHEGKRLLPADMRMGTGQPLGKAPRNQGKPEVSTDEAIAATFGML